MASTVVAEYTSDPAGKPWQVSVDDQGNLWCSCWGWVTHKTCKHLDEYNATLEPQDEPITNTDVMGETVNWMVEKYNKLQEENNFLRSHISDLDGKLSDQIINSKMYQTEKETLQTVLKHLWWVVQNRVTWDIAEAEQANDTELMVTRALSL